jgi:hypothetical protein
LSQPRHLSRRRQSLTGTKRPRRGCTLRVRHSTKNTKLPSAIEMTTASRGGRRTSVASPLKNTRLRSRRGAATCQARRWTGARCRGRPRRCLAVPQKCHHRGATRMWARPRDMQLSRPMKTRGRSALEWRLTRHAPLSRKEPQTHQADPPRQ